MISCSSAKFKANIQTSKSSFSKILKFRNTPFRVSNSLDPDQGRRFVGPDLDHNCSQKLSAVKRYLNAKEDTYGFSGTRIKFNEISAVFIWKGKNWLMSRENVSMRFATKQCSN